MARDVQLDDIEVFGDNTWRIWLRFDGGVYVSLDFAADDAESQQLFALLSNVASARLRELGERGVAINSFTPPEDDE